MFREFVNIASTAKKVEPNDMCGVGRDQEYSGA